MEIFDKLKLTPKGRRQITKKRLTLGDDRVFHFDDDSALVDDTFLQQFLTEDVFYQETQHFNNMKQREKLTINMLLCIAQCGMIVLKDEVREHALRKFIKAEDRLNYRSNAMLYLIKIGGGDPSKLVITERNRQA